MIESNERTAAFEAEVGPASTCNVVAAQGQFNDDLWYVQHETMFQFRNERMSRLTAHFGHLRQFFACKVRNVVVNSENGKHEHRPAGYGKGGK